jgi:pyridoxal phosphate enzyme (YggS family)
MTASETASGRPEIADRLARVRERVAGAAERSGRDASAVRLVVVTKDVPVDQIRIAVEAGASDLGENRVQELLPKMDQLSWLAAGPRWHFIGTLQRNKIRSVAGRVALIHSIDSIELGRAVGKRAAEQRTAQDILLEVNASGEASKHGLAPDAVGDALDALGGERGIRIQGLMTIAPQGSKALARSSFETLRDLRDRLHPTLAGSTLTELSMGMTDDFEEAIEEGATIIRVGTAIFGPRKKKK